MHKFADIEHSDRQNVFVFLISRPEVSFINNEIQSNPLIWLEIQCLMAGIKEMFYLLILFNTLFTVIWCQTIQIARGNPLPPHRLCFLISSITKAG